MVIVMDLTRLLDDLLRHLCVLLSEEEIVIVSDCSELLLSSVLDSSQNSYET